GGHLADSVNPGSVRQLAQRMSETMENVTTGGLRPAYALAYAEEARLPKFRPTDRRWSSVLASPVVASETNLFMSALNDAPRSGGDPAAAVRSESSGDARKEVAVAEAVPETAVIPALDADGDLPPGVYNPTWSDFVARFGTNPRRMHLIEGL